MFSLLCVLICFACLRSVSHVQCYLCFFICHSVTEVILSEVFFF
jgi:hypothetical protein